MGRREDILGVVGASDGISMRGVCRALSLSEKSGSTSRRVWRLVELGELERGSDGLLRVASPMARHVAKDAAPKGDRFAALVAACRSGVTFSALCDRLDMAPRKCAALLEQARAAGVAVDVAHDTVGLHWQAPLDEVVEVGPAPAVGDVFRVAVISDTHFGSRYCLRQQLADFVRHAHTEGCREVLHCGDFLDGCYRHGVYELTHSGVQDQARDAAEVLPRLPGLTYHAIMGNHDGTFSERTGLDVGRAIVAAWSEFGRSDLTTYGDRSAYLRIGGVVAHLWHPKKSEAYARTYHLQKQIERYSAIKPQLLLAGHWHTTASCAERGVEGIAVPCWQGSGSAFAKSLGGSPAIGGLILEWRLTEHGTIRDFAIRPRRYYERERIVEVRNRLGGVEVPPAVSVPVAVPEANRWESCS
jgi:predicted phosphodiesterase